MRVWQKFFNESELQKNAIYEMFSLIICSRNQTRKNASYVSNSNRAVNLALALEKWFHYYCLTRGVMCFAQTEHTRKPYDEEIKKISQYAIKRFVKEC